MQLYGVRRWGSAITEGMLGFVGQPYDFVDVEGFDKPGPASERLAEVNPLVQVPALVLDDGSVLTETAAITLYLADKFPVLAPAIGAPERRRFYHLLIWLVANVYPTFTYGDYPKRWAPSAAKELVDSTNRHRERLYRWLNDQVAGPFILGSAPSALDIYMTVLIEWGPAKDWFEQHAHHLADVAARARRLPGVDEAMRLNGWPQPS